MYIGFFSLIVLTVISYYLGLMIVVTVVSYFVFPCEQLIKTMSGTLNFFLPVLFDMFALIIGLFVAHAALSLFFVTVNKLMPDDCSNGRHPVKLMRKNSCCSETM